MKFSLGRKGLTLAGHMSPFLILIGQARTDGDGLQLSGSAEI